MEIQGTPIVHPSDISKVPGRILDRKQVKVFSLKMSLLAERFELVQYVENGKKPKWGYFPSEGHPEVVTKFDGTKATPEFLQALAYEVYVKAAGPGGDKRALTFTDSLDFFFRKERDYDKEDLAPKERGKRRQGLEVKEELIRLRTNLMIGLEKDVSERSPYLTEALNYMYKFWDEAFAYLDDGNYPIDNNIAGVSRGHYNMMLLAGIMGILFATIKEMRVGPSQSVYRNRLQTITSCVFEQSKSGERCV